MTALPDPVLPLDEGAAADAFAAILDGTVSDEVIAQFLVALRDRGETAQEIAAAAQAMRDRMIAVTAPDDAIDVCGTGGDGQHSLNVSTAVAIVVAACGVPVAKHGNRAASSKAGAADTLEALGVNLAIAPDMAERQLRDLGICFLFAQNHHPALRRLAPIRKGISGRTIFNLLGPLANPAGVRRQLVGVPKPALVATYAEAMLLLGTERALVVSGAEGLDEISIAGPTDTARIGLDTHTELDRIDRPEDWGLQSHRSADLRGGDAAHNAAALSRLLSGGRSAYRDAVLLNAAAALVVADTAGSLAEGIAMSAQAIDSGAAKALLDRWIAYA